MGKLSRQKRSVHRPNIGSPSYETDAPLLLVEVPVPSATMDGFNAIARLCGNFDEVYCKTYRLGECTVIVTRELDLWHLSIAHHSRYPTWHEITEARYRILPEDVTIAMLLPPKSEYINLHKNCFQMVQIMYRLGVPGDR